MKLETFEIREHVDDLPIWPNPKTLNEGIKRAIKLSEKYAESYQVWKVSDHKETLMFAS